MWVTAFLCTYIMKIKSTSEGIARLNALAKKIDEMIAAEEAIMPPGTEIYVITGQDLLDKYKHQNAKYIKFSLITREGCLPEV